jgi:peptidoglycan-associated lipoprotein
LAPIYFAYDRANLRDEAVDVLAHHATLLQRYPVMGLRIEGHCDERGTQEYNLALGMRRAQRAVAFFVRYGIDGRRLTPVSWGEESPVAYGHTEAAWAQNRRDEFTVQDVPDEEHEGE